jgi:hypothetical protein
MMALRNHRKAGELVSTTQEGYLSMPDPKELLRRAAELTEHAGHEPDDETRKRLLRMAESYTHLAESETWLAGHPVSIASISDVLASGEH